MRNNNARSNESRWQKEGGYQVSSGRSAKILELGYLTD